MLASTVVTPACIDVLIRNLKRLHQRSPFAVTTGRTPSELDPTTEKAMQSALKVQSIFLDMSHSATARQFPHITLELRPAETITPASLLEAHLVTAQVEQLTRGLFECSSTISLVRY
jgi:hypothetical protein